jgi:hypothetical protein
MLRVGRPTGQIHKGPSFTLQRYSKECITSLTVPNPFLDTVHSNQYQALLKFGWNEVRT